MLRRIAPDDLHLFPGHADHLGRDALAVGHRLRAEIADAGVDVHLAVRLDDEQAVEANRSADESADRDPDATHLRAVALAAGRLALDPPELGRAFVEALLQETARRIGAVAGGIRRTEPCLAFGRI